MKLAYCSDLHLEFSEVTLKNTENADVLILAGDILIAEDLHDYPEGVSQVVTDVFKTISRRHLKAQQYRDFIRQCSAEFPNVVAISGNHEFYHGKWEGSLQTLREEYAAYHNVHFMERDTIVIDGVRFIGATMWTDLNRGDPLTIHAVRDMMNDYRVIRHDEQGYTKLRPIHTVERHRHSVQYIKAVLSETRDQPTVIVGHHAPTSRSIHAEYVHAPLMNGAYYSDLSDIMLDNPQIKTWIHGHIHRACQYWVGDALVACNPLGYPGHDEDFRTFKLQYIDLDNMPAKFDEVKWGRD